MPEKFEPKDYKSYENLPEEEKQNFKKVDDGFARKKALDLEEARERADKMQEKIASGEAKDHNEADEILDQEKILSSLSENQRNELKEILESKRISGRWNVNNLYWVPKELHLKIAEIWINQGDGSFVKEWIDRFSCNEKDIMQLIVNYNIKKEKEERTARYDLVKNTELYNQLIDCDNEIQEKLNAMKIKNDEIDEFRRLNCLIRNLDIEMNRDSILYEIINVVIRSRTEVIFLPASSAIPLGWIFKEALKQIMPEKKMKFFSILISRSYLNEELYYKAFKEGKDRLKEVLNHYGLNNKKIVIIDESSATGNTRDSVKDIFEAIGQQSKNIIFLVADMEELRYLHSIKPKVKVFSEELDKLILVSQKSEDTKLLIDILKLEGKKLGILYKAFVNKEYKEGNEKYKSDAFLDSGVINKEE